MSYKLNVFNGEFDYYEGGFIGAFSSAPATAQDGQTYINNSTGGYYVWFNSTWNLLATLTPPAASYRLLEDGTSFRLLEDGVSKRLLG